MSDNKSQADERSPDRAGPPLPRARRWGAIALVAAVVGMVVLFAWPQPRSDSQAAVDAKLNEQIPLQARFRDQSGREIHLGELLRGRPVVLNLVYFRCPMLCNQVMRGLIDCMKTMDLELGIEYDVWTVSFDPGEQPDLAAAARQTALERYGRAAGDGWPFLTGDEENIRKLTDAVGFYFVYDEASGQFAHGAGLFVLTPEGRVSRFLNDVEFAAQPSPGRGVEFSSRDLRLALVQAADNEIGSVGDQVLLLCFQYDPSKGKYSLAVMRVVRIAGLVTVLGLGVGLVVLRRMERRRS